MENRKGRRSFRDIFGREENREWTLSLFNAVSGTGCTSPEDIVISTLEDPVYDVVSVEAENGASCIFVDLVDLNGQSAWNPNMPVLFLMYAARLYERYAGRNNPFLLYMPRVRLPFPRCVCLCSGTDRNGDRQPLLLSDAFGPGPGEPDIQAKVTMIHISGEQDDRILDACRPLREYARFVDAVRTALATPDLDREAAVDAAISSLPQDFLIRGFLEAHRAELKDLILPEYCGEQYLPGFRAAAQVT